MRSFIRYASHQLGRSKASVTYGTELLAGSLDLGFIIANICGSQQAAL